MLGVKAPLQITGLNTDNSSYTHYLDLSCFFVVFLFFVFLLKYNIDQQD